MALLKETVTDPAGRITNAKRPIRSLPITIDQLL